MTIKQLWNQSGDGNGNDDAREELERAESRVWTKEQLLDAARFLDGDLT